MQRGLYSQYGGYNIAIDMIRFSLEVFFLMQNKATCARFDHTTLMGEFLGKGKCQVWKEVFHPKSVCLLLV